MTADLAPAFQYALDTTVADLCGRSDVVGILFFGSAARGRAGPSSDIDLYAITDREVHGHLGRTIRGVPVEVSFGSLARFADQVRSERPTVIHAFATGRILVDSTGGGLACLCDEARATWSAGPGAITKSAALRHRFHLTDAVRDLETMSESESAESAMLGAACIQLALSAFCAAERLWLPSPRHVLGVVARRDAVFAAAVRDCAQAGFPPDTAIAVADLALARLGGRLADYDSVECPA